MLGIVYDIMETDKTRFNYIDKLLKIKKVLGCWGYRELTLVGRTTVIKTLALPILVQSLTTLPNPPSDILNDIQNTFFRFLWDGKPDRVKRKVIINNIEEGGLKFIHIESFCKALKMSWVHKLLDPLNVSPWKVLLLSTLSKYGGDKVLYLNKEGLEVCSRHLNSFWRDILLNLSELAIVGNAMNENNTTIEQVLSQPIWMNSNIKINGSSFIKPRYISKDVFFINDLFSGKNFLTYNQFQRKYEVNTNYLEYFAIISAIPVLWRRLVVDQNGLVNIENRLIDRLSKDKKPCKFFYKLYIDIIKEPPLNIQQKWGNLFELEIED